MVASRPRRSTRLSGTETPLSGGTTLCVSNFSGLNRGVKRKSEPFTAIDHKWRLVLRKNLETPYLSVFLEIVSKNIKRKNWRVPAVITYTLLNNNNPLDNRIQETSHAFTPDESDWGYHNFIPLKDIAGYVSDDDSLHVIVTVSYSLSLARQAAGMVGLKNQGATCYMNSLLQTLFHLGIFRQAVYSMPTDSEEPLNEEKNIPLALQRVFYRLQFGKRSVCTKNLTKAFGWDAGDAFTQHDVQELKQVLCDNLAEKMKGTCSEGTISDLFKGTSISYISCTEIDYTSKRTEEFYDISLNVRDCKTIYESFDQYVAEELMEGDNKYMAEGKGLQTARKGIKFVSFPPVLFIQLKRFEYDYAREVMTKINDRLEFPVDLDLSRYKSEDTDIGEDLQYRLYSVLVHNGDIYSGHYYSYQRPFQNPNWYKFDDELVHKVSEEEAVARNFGGDYNSTNNLKTVNQYASAYLLVYIRESEVTNILRDEKELNIPYHLKKKFEIEQQTEERQYEKTRERRRYITAGIATLQSLKRYSQTPDFDLFDFSNNPPLHDEIRIRKDSTINDLKRIIQEYYGIPKELQRLWKWIERENETFRIQRPLAPTEDDQAIEIVSKNKSRWLLYLEEIPEISMAIRAYDHTKNLCLFFKYYSPVEEKIEFIGSELVSSQLNIKALKEVIIKQILCLESFTGDLLLYEERSPTRLVPLTKKTLEKLDIVSGDIIIFQLVLPNPEMKSAYLSLPEYYKYFDNRITVEFHPLPTGSETENSNGSFEIELSRLTTYSQLELVVAEKLHRDAKYLRFTRSNGSRPHTHPIIKSDHLRSTLDEFLGTSEEFLVPVVYYELLDVPLAELETKKLLLIKWQNEKAEVAETVKLLVPKHEKMEYVLKLLPEHVKVVYNSGIRLMEVNGSKIIKAIANYASVNVSVAGSIVAEEIRPEEASKEPGDRIINVAHAWGGPEGKQTLRFFGNPFRCISKKDETVRDFLQRIRVRLGLTEEETSDWKCGIFAYGDCTFLEPDDMINNYQLRNHTHLVLHHVNKNAPSSRRQHKPIKIYN